MKILALLILTALNLGAQTLYLAPGSFGGTGKSAADPLYIPDADFFDAVIRHADGRYDEIILLSGVFETKGLWNFPLNRNAAATEFASLRYPISLRGSGMYKTTLKLAAAAVTRANNVDRPDLCVMRFGNPWQNNSGPFTVEDLTVDGNHSAFPTNKFIAGGLVFHSNNVTCRRVRIINLRGDFDTATEAFGILVNSFDPGSYPGPDGNNRIEDCLVESNGDVEHYVSPFYISTQERAGRPLAINSIRYCRTIGTGKNPTRIGVSLQSNTRIDEFYGHNVAHAIYNDVRPVKNAIVENSVFTGITYAGAFFIVDAPKERILIRRCSFDFTPSPGRDWIGLTVWDKYTSQAWAKDIRVEDCVFSTSRIITRPFTPYSIKANISQWNFAENNILPHSYSIQKPVTNIIVAPP